MGYARKNLVSLQDTPYYHCIARCVRRAWLWGVDEYAGKDYSHRKQWVIERLAQLANIFSIEICAYAVMSNHYHLVLYVNRERARKWSQRTVVEHWEQLFRLPPSVQRGAQAPHRKPNQSLPRESSKAGERVCSISAGSCAA